MKKMEKAFAFLLCVAMICTLLCALPLTVSAEDTSDYIPIRTVEELYNIRNAMDESYILMNDIDLTEATAKDGDWDYLGNGWNPIGSNNIYGNEKFSGVFDGGGHAIIGMRIELTTVPQGTANTLYFGLFSNVSGEVRNLKMVNTNINISTNADRNIYLGSIAGQASGSISMCSSSGKINANSTVLCKDNYHYSYLGGIVGRLTGTVQQCFNQCYIDAYYGYNTYCFDRYLYCGGIAGYVIDGIIENSYHSGQIQASGHACGSGIVHKQTNSQIVNCYSIDNGIATGDSVTNCYYLQDGSNITGATSLTETQMKLTSMYVGFDFDYVWIQNTSAGYPYPQLRSIPQDLSEQISLVRLVTLPDKLSYYKNDLISPNGATLEIVYVSGRSQMIPVTSDMLSGYDMSKTGTQTVTLTYNDFTDSFEITVERRPTISSISMASLPKKTSFVIGSDLDFSGASVYISYANGSSEIKDISECTLTGANNNKLGNQTVTVSIYEFETSFDITIEPLKVEQLLLNSFPTKLNYTDKENLDTSGMVLTAYYNNGKTSVITTGYSVTGYENVPGTHTLTVSYGGKTVSFDVTVHCSEHQSTYEATCTEDQVCSVCGEVMKEKLGHNYKAVATPATCTLQGYTTHTCTRCENSYVDSYIAPLGHTPGAAATCTIEQTCTICGTVLTEKLGHEYKTKIVLPSCTESGYTLHTCIRCNQSYTDTYTDPIGHHTPGAAATCATNQTCTVCGAILAGKTGHTPGAAATCTTDQICTACGEIIAGKTGHTPGAAATCTTDQICTACGEVIANKLGHDFSSEWTIDKNETCTESGIKSHHCSRCGEKEDETEIPATGHTPGAAATCTTDQICTACGEVIADKLGHDFSNEWTIDIEASVNAKGSKSHHCARCDEKTDITEIPMLEDVSEVFEDVSASSWYYNAVQYAVDNNLFKGVSNNEFAPNVAMSRAMLVTVLWRIEGTPEASGANAFADVASGKYYTTAVLWASSNGIVNGVSANSFAPDKNVTREQLAAILYRYASSKGYDTTGTADLSVYPDGNTTSSYAKVALAWANAKGLITGTKSGDKTLLDPKGSATRAQVATILMRFSQSVAK